MCIVQLSFFIYLLIYLYLYFLGQNFLLSYVVPILSVGSLQGVGGWPQLAGGTGKFHFSWLPWIASSTKKSVVCGGPVKREICWVFIRNKQDFYKSLWNSKHKAHKALMEKWQVS